MSKTKADIIMANAVKYGLVNYRADTMEPLCTTELGELIREDMAKNFDADPSAMLNTQGTETGRFSEPVEPEDFTGLPTHEPVMNIVEEFLVGQNPCAYYKLNNEGVVKFEQVLKLSKP